MSRTSPVMREISVQIAMSLACETTLRCADMGRMIAGSDAVTNGRPCYGGVAGAGVGADAGPLVAGGSGARAYQPRSIRALST